MRMFCTSRSEVEQKNNPYKMLTPTPTPLTLQNPTRHEQLLKLSCVTTLSFRTCSLRHGGFKVRACLPVNQERHEMNISKINFILLPLWPAALILTSVLNGVSTNPPSAGLEQLPGGNHSCLVVWLLRVRVSYISIMPLLLCRHERHVRLLLVYQLLGVIDRLGLLCLGRIPGEAVRQRALRAVDLRSWWMHEKHLRPIGGLAALWSEGERTRPWQVKLSVRLKVYLLYLWVKTAINMTVQ